MTIDASDPAAECVAIRLSFYQHHHFSKPFANCLFDTDKLPSLDGIDVCAYEAAARNG